MRTPYNESSSWEWRQRMSALLWLFLLIRNVRSIRPVNLTRHPEYFDELLLLLQQEQPISSVLTPNIQSFTHSPHNNLIQVAVSDDYGDNRIYRIAKLAAFLPFTSNSNELETLHTVHNDGAALLLAIHNVNELLEQQAAVDNNNNSNDPLGTIRLFPSHCNLRLSADLYDTHMDPVIGTSTVTRVLQTEGTPQISPTALLGAYRSGVTMPLAILSGVSEAPLMSYAATSKGFQYEDQYPLLSRTSFDSEADAAAAVDYFAWLGVRRLALLFVTDAFGSALQKAFQERAAQHSFEMESVAFRLRGSDKDISDAVLKLKQSDKRYFFVVCLDEHYENIVTKAYDAGIVGDDYHWVFYGMDTGTLVERASYSIGSVLANATAGIGLLEMGSGKQTDIHPTIKAIEPIPDPPVGGYDRMRASWIARLRSPYILTYFLSRMPKFGTFSPEPSAQSLFMYDSVLSLAISMCNAQDTFFSGTNVTAGLANVSFDGASGKVQFGATGTRDISTSSYTMWNSQLVTSSDLKGNHLFFLSPTSIYSKGSWTTTSGKTFVYADGTAVPPSQYPNSESQESSSSVSIALVLAGISFVSGLYCVAWTLCNRNEPVVCASQPAFLLLVGAGSLIMTSAILPLSRQDSIDDATEDSVFVCMAPFWLYVGGFSLAFSPLALKAWLFRQVFYNPDSERVFIGTKDLFRVILSLYLPNLILLLSWTLVAPNEWTIDSSKDKFGRVDPTIGSCQGSKNASIAFPIAILFLNLFVLVVSSWWSYRALDLDTEYSENKYISFSLGATLEVFVVASPLMALLNHEPGPRFFVFTGFTLLTSFVVLLLIFWPKVRFLRNEKKRRKEEQRVRLFEENSRRVNSEYFNTDRCDQDCDKKQVESASYTNIFGGFSRSVDSDESEKDGLPEAGIRINRHPRDFSQSLSSSVSYNSGTGSQRNLTTNNGLSMRDLMSSRS